MSKNLLSPLKTLIQEKALKKGDFTLKSGQKSSYYIDLRNVTLHQKGLRLIADSISGVIEDLDEIDAVGGPCVGADPIVGALLYMKTMDPDLRGFLIRKEEKQHGIDGLIIGSVLPGDSCVIVEDVTTSGGSLLRACQIAQEYGCTISEVISVVDRNAGAKELFEANQIKFSSLFNIDELL